MELTDEEIIKFYIALKSFQYKKSSTQATSESKKGKENICRGKTYTTEHVPKSPRMGPSHTNTNTSKEIEMRTLVLVIEGKREEHYRYGVACFEYEEQAKEWCEELNKEQMHKKYWRYAEIIKPDMLYEVNTEKCWDGEIKLYDPDKM